MEAWEAFSDGGRKRPCRRGGHSEVAPVYFAGWFLIFACLVVTPPAIATTRAQNTASEGSKEGPSDGRLQAAKRLLREEKIGRAESTVRGYLAEHQESAEAHFLLGLILFRKIQATGLESMSAAGSSDPATLPVDGKFREENAKASLAEFTEGAKYRKPTAADLKIVALDYVLLGDYADASKWLAVAVEWDPKDAEGWYYLGRSKYSENRFEEAVRAFMRCLELDPRNSKAETNLGLSYAGLNRIPEAVAAFQSAIGWQQGTAQGSAEPYIGLGDLLIQQNRAAEAVAYLRQAVQIAPRESRAREKLGSAYLNLGQLAEAEEQLEAAVSLDAKNASLHYLLGSVYRKQGRTEKANTEFARFQALKDVKGTARP